MEINTILSRTTAPLMEYRKTKSMISASIKHCDQENCKVNMAHDNKGNTYSREKTIYPYWDPNVLLYLAIHLNCIAPTKANISCIETPVSFRAISNCKT